MAPFSASTSLNGDILWLTGWLNCGDENETTYALSGCRKENFVLLTACRLICGAATLAGGMLLWPSLQSTDLCVGDDTVD